jgi:hypothetical protein
MKIGNRTSKWIFFYDKETANLISQVSFDGRKEKLNEVLEEIKSQK